MERYLSAKQVAEILNCSDKTAYNVIHEMPFLERPLRVSERILKQYIEDHTVYPVISKRRTA